MSIARQKQFPKGTQKNTFQSWILLDLLVTFFLNILMFYSRFLKILSQQVGNEEYSKNVENNISLTVSLL